MDDRANSMMKWDVRFLELARHVSEWSKDPSTKFGAVIVDDDRKIVSIGYNGFPQAMQDQLDWLNDRQEKYSRVIHAEVNAILNSPRSVRGCSLYVFPFCPCDRCAVLVIQSGIKRVISRLETPLNWHEACHKAQKYFDETGVEVTLI